MEEKDRVISDMQPGRCPECGASLPPNANFCPSCGASLATSCRFCGAKVGMNDKFCASCGRELSSYPESIAKDFVFVDSAGTAWDNFFICTHQGYTG